MNIGLTNVILSILDKETSMWTRDLLETLREIYPEITYNQLCGTLASLERYGKVLHLCRGTWACKDYPNR